MNGSDNQFTEKELSGKELSEMELDNLFEEILSERGLFEDDYPGKNLVMRIFTENCPGLIRRALERFHRSSVKELFRVKEPLPERNGEDDGAGEGVPFPRFTALDRYGDPYLPALIRSADPCEDCPEERTCRDCRYAEVVKALYCHEEAASAREEHRRPVPPRSIPRPRSLFFERHEKPDPVEALCEALFSPLSGNGTDANCFSIEKSQKRTEK